MKLNASVSIQRRIRDICVKILIILKIENIIS